MTMAVAMPATTMAPRGPDRTILSILASSASDDSGASWGTIMASSVKRCGAKFVRLSRRYGSAAGAPGRADVGDHRGDLIVGRRRREGRQAVGHGISGRARRVAAVEHHSNGVDGGRHLDGLVAGE